MNIASVMALPTGGYEVTTTEGDIVTVANGDTPERAALSAWFRAGNTATPYAPPLDEAKARLTKVILAQMEAIGRSLVAKYPLTEQQGWPVKIIEAQGVVDATLTEGDAAYLGIEAALTGETVADLATATVDAAALTAMIPPITAGLRRRLETAIAAAGSEADLADIRTAAEDLRTTIMAAFATGDVDTVKAALAGLNS